MIVKDEERHLAACLESVRDVVDEIVVVDTGSTDATISIAERHGARVLHHPWTGDFSAARNASLAAATCDWILVLDADERLVADSKGELRRLLHARDVAGYSLICESLIGSGEGEQFQSAPVFRLLLNQPGIRFEGLIHEQAIGTAKKTGLLTATSSVKIRHLGYMASEIVLRDKRQRNLAILERQAVLEPDNAFVRFNLGEVLKLLRRFEEAEGQYVRALELLKASGASASISYVANLYFSLGDLYRELGRYSQAHTLLDEGVALYPGFADLHYTKGFAYFDAGRYDEAIAEFGRCRACRGIVHPFATDPEVPGAKAERAMADCYIRLQDRSQALSHLEAALQLSSSPAAELHANLGILYLEAGQEDRAIEQFQLAVTKDPQEIRSWLNLSMLWIQRGAYEQAAAAWAHRPEDPACQALLSLGSALSGAGLPVDSPSESILLETWCDVVDGLMQADRLQPVQDLLDRLDELGAKLPLEWALGQLFSRRGLHDLAIDCLLRVQQRTPRDPAVYRALGDACLASGSASDARIMYAKVLEFAPNDVHASARLQQLT